jgi:Fe-S cluster biogenesis protein NfuA
MTEPDIAARQGQLDELFAVIAEAVEADGGTVHQGDHDLAAGVIMVSLSGACGTCSVANTTLDDGIERILRQRLDWVTSVVGTVIADDDGATGYGGWTPR